MFLFVVTLFQFTFMKIVQAGSLAHRDLHAPTMQRKDCTNPDRAQQTSSIPAYEEWVKQRDKSKKTSERHRLHVREQLERDEEIPKVCIYDQTLLYHLQFR